MFCGDCGTPVQGRFCSSCGSPVPEEAVVTKSVTPDDMPVSVPPRTSRFVMPEVNRAALKRHAAKPSVIVAVGVLLVALVVSVALLTKGGEGTQKALSPSDQVPANATYAHYVSSKGQVTCYEAVWGGLDKDFSISVKMNLGPMIGPALGAAFFMDNFMAGSRYDDALPDAASRFNQAAQLAGQHIWEKFGRATPKQITQSWDLDGIAERACRQVGYKGPGDPYP